MNKGIFGLMMRLFSIKLKIKMKIKLIIVINKVKDFTTLQEKFSKGVLNLIS